MIINGICSGEHLFTSVQVYRYAVFAKIFVVFSLAPIGSPEFGAFFRPARKCSRSEFGANFFQLIESSKIQQPVRLALCFADQTVCCFLLFSSRSPSEVGQKSFEVFTGGLQPEYEPILLSIDAPLRPESLQRIVMLRA